ncbi:MAG: hypothetical protein IKB34_09610 [Clostridia bacterium]|nr:hypothetical protein [Clostridia bacterium]
MSRAKKTQKTSPRQLLRESIFWLSVILFVFLPFISSFILQTVILTIDGNIAYKTLTPALITARDLIAVFNAYAGIGVLACAVAYFGAGGAKGTVAMAMLYHPAVFLASMCAYPFSGAKSYIEAIFVLGTDMLINTAVYAVILLILILIRRHKLKKGEDITAPLNSRLIARGGTFSYPNSAIGTFAIFQISALMYSMISAFVDPSIGTPINVREWVYWITEYLTCFIYAAIGYVIAVGICYLCEYYLKHFAVSEKKA